MKTYQFFIWRYLKVELRVASIMPCRLSFIINSLFSNFIQVVYFIGVKLKEI